MVNYTSGPSCSKTGLNFNPGFFLSFSKAFPGTILSIVILCRASDEQIVDKKNLNWIWFVLKSFMTELQILYQPCIILIQLWTALWPWSFCLINLQRIARWVLALRKQPTFRDTTTGFPTEWCLRNEQRNSDKLITHQYRANWDLGSVSNWLSHKGTLGVLNQWRHNEMLAVFSGCLLDLWAQWISVTHKVWKTWPFQKDLTPFPL